MNKKKTSVLIATGSFGGPATYSKLLKERLPEYGYEITVVNFGTVLGYPKLIRHGIFFFKILIKSLGSDIIYAQDPVSTGLPGLMAAKMMRKRFFLKIVGDYAWEQGQQRGGVVDLLDDFSVKDGSNYSNSKLVRILKKIQTFVARHAERIITPSNYLKKIIGNWGIDTDKITVVYNAFNKPVIPEGKEEIRRELHYESDVVLSVGRLVPWKGLDVLVEAAPLVLKELPKTKFFIIGDGPDKEFLQSKIKKVALEHSIIILQHMPQKDMYRHLKAADAFVLISSYEGFSHLVIETLAIGTPIVNTPIGGNVEVIEDGKNGLFVPYGDHKKTAETIVRLLKSKELRNSLSSNGMKIVDRFSQETMLKNLSAVLR